MFNIFFHKIEHSKKSIQHGIKDQSQFYIFEFIVFSLYSLIDQWEVSVKSIDPWEASIRSIDQWEASIKSTYQREATFKSIDW